LQAKQQLSNDDCLIDYVRPPAAAGDWTSGFFPGVLWQLYELTGKPQWADLAQQWQAALAEHQRDWWSQHDYGGGVRIAMASSGTSISSSAELIMAGPQMSKTSAMPPTAVHFAASPASCMMTSINLSCCSLNNVSNLTSAATTACNIWLLLPLPLHGNSAMCMAHAPTY